MRPSKEMLKLPDCIIVKVNDGKVEFHGYQQGEAGGIPAVQTRSTGSRTVEGRSGTQGGQKMGSFKAQKEVGR